MTAAIYTALTILASAFLALGWRAYQNHLELSRLRRNGHRRVAFPRLSNRGHVDHEFLRGLTEFLFLLFMLGAVLGWMTHSTPQ